MYLEYCSAPGGMGACVYYPITMNVYSSCSNEESKKSPSPLSLDLADLDIELDVQAPTVIDAHDLEQSDGGPRSPAPSFVNETSWGSRQ
jgi:hypothetical protein